MTDLGDFTTVTIDKREPEGMEELFMELEYMVKWVQHDSDESYDYRQGGVVIERKTIQDFISSFKGDHMWDQLNKMLQYDYVYLIIVGDIEEAEYGRYGATIPQVLGAISSIMTRYQIPTAIVRNDNKFAYMAGKIFKSHREGKVNQPRRTKISNINKNLSTAARIISLVPGMDSLAQNIAEKLDLHDIWDVAMISEKQLMSVDLIGKKKARNIIKYLGISKE